MSFIHHRKFNIHQRYEILSVIKQERRIRDESCGLSVGKQIVNHGKKINSMNRYLLSTSIWIWHKFKGKTLSFL